MPSNLGSTWTERPRCKRLRVDSYLNHNGCTQTGTQRFASRLRFGIGRVELRWGSVRQRANFEPDELALLLGNMFGGEFTNMILKRHLRTAVWAMLLVGNGAASFLIPWTDYAGGDFEVRAETRAELRAPVAGFLARIIHDAAGSHGTLCDGRQLGTDHPKHHVSRGSGTHVERNSFRLLEFRAQTE